jgi:hypothetical protein
MRVIFRASTCRYLRLYLLCICVRILLHMCPFSAACVSSNCCMFVLKLLRMCPHTATHLASSNCYRCVLKLLHMCPQTATHLASANCYICGEGERDL